MLGISGIAIIILIFVSACCCDRILNTNHIIRQYGLQSKHAPQQGITQGKTWKKEIAWILIMVIDEIFKNSNETALEMSIHNEKECLNTIIGSIASADIAYLVYYSGFSFMNLGKRIECEGNGYYHLFLELNITPHDMDYEYDNQSFSFIDQHIYFLGICLWNNCHNVYQTLFDHQLNQQFFGTLKKEFRVQNVTLSKKLNKDKPFHISFYICFISLAAYLMILIVIYFIGYLYYSEDFCSEENDKNAEVRDYLIPTEEPSRIHDDDITEDISCDSFSGLPSNTYMKTFPDRKSRGDQTNDIRNLEKFLQNESECLVNENQRSIHNDIIQPSLGKGKCLTFFEKLFDFFSVSTSLKTLFSIKNKYYNDTEIESVGGMRTLLMLCIALNRCVVSFYRVPSNLAVNDNFYRSYMMTLIKYSTYATTCWIFIDGFLFAYKLMFFLKKVKKQSLKVFFGYFCNVIPKVVTFFFALFMFVYHSDEFALIYFKTHRFAYFKKRFLHNFCFKNPYSFFIPFYIPYYCDGQFDEFNTNYEHCFKFVYQCLNEFYCVIFMLILFYFLCKAKSRKLDAMIALLFLVNISISYLSFAHVWGDETKYTLKYFLGESLSVMFPHLMINIFFMGTLCGILYFYYIESVADVSLYLELDYYYPFSFCFTIMQNLIKLKKKVKCIIAIVSCAMQILLCAVFSIMVHIYLDEGKLLFDFKFIWKLVYIYETYIFIFLYAVFFIIVLSTDMPALKTILNNRIFLTMGRISFSFLCFSEIFIYLFYSLFDLSGIKWNYQSLVSSAVVLWVLVCCISTISTVLFEQPVRVIVKQTYVYE